MIAWITGGGTGIGRALAEQLYQSGARVVITGRRKEILEEAARYITARPGRGELMAMAGDASNPSHVNDVISRTAEKWGAVTLLVNNAGVHDNLAFSEAAAEDYQKSFDMNCVTAIRATEAVLPEMLKAGQGAIANISSIYGRWASFNSASYSVGKYALAGYTDALRQSLVGKPIHVLGVYPGFIKTSMTMPFVEPGSLKSYLGKSPEQMAKAILKALHGKKTDLYYPWYVPWVLRLHRWTPKTMDRLVHHVKH